MHKNIALSEPIKIEYEHPLDVVKLFAPERISYTFNHVLARFVDACSEARELGLEYEEPIFLKEFNREKGKMPLETYKEYFNLKRLYEEKDNKVKLQDILAFKNINRESFHINLNDEQINIIGNNNQNYSYKLFYDPKLEIQYFYAQLPISWLKNDDEQGLQPRVIDFKRLNQLHKHFQSFPQLAPSIARLVNNDIKLFDGQHKLAAQILNNNMFIDIKVYISPKDEIKAKNIYEKLLKTNLEAHSKLAQVSFQSLLHLLLELSFR